MSYLDEYLELQLRAVLSLNVLAGHAETDLDRYSVEAARARITTLREAIDLMADSLTELVLSEWEDEL